MPHGLFPFQVPLSRDGRRERFRPAPSEQPILRAAHRRRGQQAWDTIRDMWRDNDKGRIRQVILQGRSRGVLAEINRQPAPPATPPPPSQ